MPDGIRAKYRADWTLSIGVASIANGGWYLDWCSGRGDGYE
jgi:hypothetical protein